MFTWRFIWNLLFQGVLVLTIIKLNQFPFLNEAICPFDEGYQQLIRAVEQLPQDANSSENNNWNL